MALLFELPQPRSATRTPSATAAMAVLIVAIGASVGAQPTVTEDQVKAAYLYNFTHFATWPVAAFEGPAGPLRVCTVGENGGLGQVLADTLRNESVDGHPLTLLRSPASSDLPRCHLLFISAKTRADAILNQVSRAPVLTISDGEGFMRRGGMLEFVSESGRVRFDVNLPAVSARGITLSARLLQVARKVQQ